MNKILKILVLSGGGSNEREISLRSGEHVCRALEIVGHIVTMADPANKDFVLSEITRNIDLVVIMLHGVGGEDGTVQSELDTLGIPYIGSKPKSCRLAIDKVATKKLMAEQGILTPAWQVVDKGQFLMSGLREGSYVLKPIRGGSSIDTLIVLNPEHQYINEADIDNLFERNGTMLLEELVTGEEITVGVLGDDVLPVLQIIPPLGEQFDYENKYNGKTKEVVNPPGIGKSVMREAQEVARRLHEIVGCRHLSRTDMIIADNGALCVLEINTIPGMTEQSLYPKAAQAAGYDMPALFEELIRLGIKQ